MRAVLLLAAGMVVGPLITWGEASSRVGAGGNKIVFARAPYTVEDEPWVLLSVSATGGTPRPLFTRRDWSPSIHDEGPTWSGDGRLLAFTRSVWSPWRGVSVFVVNADGTGVRRVAAGSSPALSPDGRQLAFYRDGAVWVVRVADRRQTFTFVGRGYGPAWSPDGRTIAFLRESDPAPRLMLARLGHSGTRSLPIRARIPEHENNQGSIRELRHGVGWSADGTQIKVDGTSLHPGSWAVVRIVRADGSGDLAFDGQGRCEWSPASGGRCERNPRVEEGHNRGECVWSPARSELGCAALNSVEILDPRSVASRRVVRTNGTVGRGLVTLTAWSPDGNDLAYTRCGAGPDQCAIAIVSRTGGASRTLVRRTPVDTTINSLTWQPGR